MQFLSFSSQSASTSSIDVRRRPENDAKGGISTSRRSGTNVIKLIMPLNEKLGYSDAGFLLKKIGHTIY